MVWSSRVLPIRGRVRVGAQVANDYAAVTGRVHCPSPSSVPASLLL